MKAMTRTCPLSFHNNQIINLSGIAWFRATFHACKS